MGLFHHRTPAEALPDGWQDVLASRLAHWEHLDDAERDQLGQLTGRMLAEKHWEAANGFTLTPDISLVIAAEASLLVLGLSFEHYRDVGAVIVYPSTVTLHGSRGAPVAGLMTDAPMPILGEAMERGPIIIAWDSAAADARHPERGHNVVFHEFAHKLDMLGEAADGMPPMPPDLRPRWMEVCTREYESLQSGDDPLLSSYAGVNPAEFFAVATEVFFDVPSAMRDAKPDLYAVLMGFYQQDPAAREDRLVTRPSPDPAN